MNISDNNFGTLKYFVDYKEVEKLQNAEFNAKRSLKIVP
jgi:hypothetical protein